MMILFSLFTLLSITRFLIKITIKIEQLNFSSVFLSVVDFLSYITDMRVLKQTIFILQFINTQYQVDRKFLRFCLLLR